MKLVEITILGRSRETWLKANKSNTALIPHLLVPDSCGVLNIFDLLETLHFLSLLDTPLNWVSSLATPLSFLELLPSALIKYIHSSNEYPFSSTTINSTGTGNTSIWIISISLKLCTKTHTIVCV